MHLGDLHLGRSILEQSLIEDQKYILNSIINIIEEKSIDVVMLCGDIYDKSIPSIEAVNLFSDFLTNLVKLSVKVLIISGNHDSKDRLCFGNDLFVSNGIYIEGGFDGNLKKIVFSDEYGNINFYMLPFIKPYDVRLCYSENNIDSYDEMIKIIIDNADIDANERNVIMLHQFVTASGVDVIRSDSEVMSLGGIDNVDVSNFDSFDYVAMGHIHRAQKLVRDTVRYCGSPLKYSFSEVNHNKSVPIIEFKEKEDISIELVDLVPLRDMRVIKGPIDRLIDKDIVSLGNSEDYINAIITDNDYVMDAIGKLRRVYKNVLKIDYCNVRTGNNIDYDEMIDFDIKQRNELDLFSEFYKKQNNIDLDENKSKLVKDIVSSLKNK